MSDLHLTADDLLAGSAAVFDVAIPRVVLHPDGAGREAAGGRESDLVVQLRPVTIGTFQLIMRAAKSDAGLIPLLLIKESLAKPSLSLEQVRQMHLGLVQFLIAHIREISGLTEKKSSSAT